MVNKSLVSRISQVKDLSRSQEVKKNPRNQVLYKRIYTASKTGVRGYVSTVRGFLKRPLGKTMPFKGAERICKQNTG